MTSLLPRASLLGFALLFYVSAESEGNITFAPGDYYSADYSSLTVTQYDVSGAAVGSLTLPSSYGSGIQGITFGADGLMYATFVRGSNGFAVLALDSSGSIHETYAGSVYTAGNLSFGRVATDGTYLYVTGQDQLTRFLLGNPNSGTAIYSNNQVFDVKPLPNGHLFVASAYSIAEITTSGALVRTISLQGDDNYFTDIRGIEYNPATNELFVSELGHTGFEFQLMRLNAATGLLEKNTTFNYAGDLTLTSSGELLVGSWTQTPRFYDQDLNQTGALSGGPQLTVAQYPVPEPTTAAYVFVGVGAIAAIRTLRRLAS